MKKRGSITVESAIILPVYILVILFVIHFLNISYLQLVIQQGLNNAGRTMAEYSYAIDIVLGIEKINESGFDKKVQKIEPVIDNFNTITAKVADIFGDFSLDKIKDFITEGKKFYSSIEIMQTSLKGITGEEVVSYLLTAGAETGLTVFVKALVEEYLKEMKVNRAMLDGDISYAVCMNDTSNDIVLIAVYRYRLGMFSLFTDGIAMRQVVVVHPWIGGSTKGVRQK